jgi:hypothetical protein
MPLLLVDGASQPQVIIHSTDDNKDAADVAQRYATQTGRTIQVFQCKQVASIKPKVETPTEYDPNPVVVQGPRSVDGT